MRACTNPLLPSENSFGLLALAHLRAQSIRLLLCCRGDKFGALRFEQGNGFVDFGDFVCHNAVFTHESWPDGHVPKTDLANAVAKPDDTGPKVVLYAKLIDGHGEIEQAD
jgi:hypothetical protein